MGQFIFWIQFLYTGVLETVRYCYVGNNSKKETEVVNAVLTRVLMCRFFIPPWHSQKCLDASLIVSWIKEKLLSATALTASWYRWYTTCWFYCVHKARWNQIFAKQHMPECRSGVFKFLCYLNVVNGRPGAYWSLYAQARVRANDLSYEEMTS